MNIETIKILESISNDIVEIVQMVLADDDIGENIKVKKNTLKDSELAKSVAAKLDADNCIINLLINQYIEYIERGRERYHTPKVPIDALRNWALKKLGKADNETLFKIQNSIFQFGIRPRPIMYYVFEKIDQLMADKFDDLFNAVLVEVNNYFID